MAFFYAKKKDDSNIVFLPQIYHKLNLLLWFSKYRQMLQIVEIILQVYCSIIISISQLTNNRC